jgi:hypothetical protein
MAIAYNIIDIRGKASENVIAEILFQNKTISEGLVTFEEEVKNEVIFSEGSTSVAMQAYTSGTPTSSGSLNLFDVVITPAKYMYYQTFDPNTLRPSRFKRDMKAGAWEVLSSEFERVVIGGMYAEKISYDAELKFWSGITSANQTAIAGLTAGTANTSIGADEKTVAAALTAGQINGVVASMMYNSWNSTLTAGVGKRIKVDGVVVTSVNIQDEVEKVYKAIPAELLASATQPVIYMPHVNKQLINSHNNIVTNYKTAFVVSGNKYYYNDVEIVFVPIPANVMIAMAKQHVFWVTDLTSDVNKVEINKTALNEDLMFIKHVGTLACYIANQQYNVLYCGA